MLKPNQTKPNQTKLCNVLIPLFLLWSFLFYLLWSAPLSLILQMYEINSLYLGSNNSYLKIVNIVTASFGAILLITALIPFKISQIINRIFVGIIVFAVTLTCLYNTILPYNYGAFNDNIELTTDVSLLGFSKWYYLLDVLIIGGSIVAAYYIKTSPKVLFLFILFYSVENIQAFVKGSSSLKEATKLSETTILSKNHENILYYAYDGWGPTLAKYFLTNETSFTPEEKAWAKDFTFYDNVVAYSFINTAGSLSSMYEGYKNTSLNLFKNMLEYDKNFAYVCREPLINFSNDLSPYADIQDLNQISFSETPILLPKIYASIPYFVRNTIAFEFSWKFENRTHWILENYTDRIVYTATNTDKPQILYFLSQSTHMNWSSTKYPNVVFEKHLNTVEGIEDVLLHNTKDLFVSLTDLVHQLKEQGIYDNTKIIVLSDHDTHIAYKTLVQLISNVGPNPSFGDYLIDTAPHPYSTLMIKDFNTTQNKMQINNRFLTLADIRGNIEHSLGLTELPDFIGDDYVDRVVNIPRAGHHDDFHNLLKADRRREVRRNLTNIDIFKIKNINPIDFEVVNIPVSELENIPPYEIVK